MLTDTTVTVSRRDISIYEEPAYEDFYNSHPAGWYATFSGRTSSGEYVSFGRRADTVQGALADLEKEIAANGWEITA